MTYHKDFWVVVGTAAPVLLLAQTIAFAQGMERYVAAFTYSSTEQARLIEEYGVVRERYERSGSRSDSKRRPSST
jgi:hypothetical protein